MRTRIFCTAALLGLALLPTPSIAQEPIPEFNKLRTPESPAFTILGIAPTEVHRPTTPATFATNFLEDFTGDGGLLPKSFALETAPYWWFSHPALTLSEYADPGPKNLYRNLSFSVATTSEGGEVESSIQRIGLGLRTSVVSGKAVSDQCIARVHQAAETVSRAVGREVAVRIAADPTLASDSARLEKLRGKLFQAAVDNLPQAQRALLDAETKSCVNNLSARRGFVLDLSAGSALTFPGGRVDDGELTTAGVWITPAYLSGSFSGVGVLRARWNALETDTTATSIDVGLRAVYSRDRIAASFEGVWRHVEQGDESDNLYRVAAIFDILLTGDLWLSATFGKDFRGDEPNSFVALANLTWNVGDRTVRPSFE